MIHLQALLLVMVLRILNQTPNTECLALAKAATYGLPDVWQCQVAYSLALRLAAAAAPPAGGEMS